MPRHLSVGPELGHDLVEPNVGGLQGLVEHVEAGGAHVSPPMIAPWFCSGNAPCRPQFQRLVAGCSRIRRNRLKVPAKFSSDIGLSRSGRLCRCKTGTHGIVAGGTKWCAADPGPFQ